MNEQLNNDLQRIVADYFSRYYSYISPARAGRPQDFPSAQAQVLPDPAQCVFCPGNEEKTPPEIGRIADDQGSWRMRWFANKYAALVPTNPDAYGYHEIIVETPKPDKQLWDLPEQDFVSLLTISQERVRVLAQDEKIASVVVFKNHGKEAGASLVHSHAQIIASALPLSNLRQLEERSQQLSACLYCKVLQEEEGSDRIIAQNNDFIALCPKAPRFSLEAWLVAKRHEDGLLELGQAQLSSLSQLLSTLLSRLKTIPASYSFFLTYSPRSGQRHIHLDVLPSLHAWAGFELAAGDYIVSTSPEQAAQFYRND